MAELRNRPGLLTGRISTNDAGFTFALYSLSLLGALVISGGLVAATGGSALDVLSALLDGSIRSPGAWGLTLTTAAPLLLVAIGTIVATRAGLVNIGQEGQVLIGAAFAGEMKKSVFTALNYLLPSKGVMPMH
ncbi:phosphoenolpyruvate carboxykinase (ATP), partial [Ilumatobacter sp.]|uniref:phosphoenolpyruvate carboxykinase (ATP) n=1 Tax=Ilumatobacter sp. TaxID=1967498 RepID=UPI003C52F4F2